MLITSGVPRAGSTDLSTTTGHSWIPSSGWDLAGACCSSRRPRSCESGLSPRRGRRSSTRRTAATSPHCTCSASSRRSRRTNPRTGIERAARTKRARSTYRDEDPEPPSSNWTARPVASAASAADAGAAKPESGTTIGGERSTVRRLLEHALHDSLHHLDDVNRGLQALRS